MQFALIGTVQGNLSRLQWEPELDGHPDAQPAELYSVIPLLDFIGKGEFGGATGGLNDIVALQATTTASCW